MYELNKKKGISYHHYHSLREPKNKIKKVATQNKKILKKKKMLPLYKSKTRQNKGKKKEEENLIVVAKQKVGLWIKP